MNRTLDDLYEFANENLHFLDNSLTAFDKGQFFEVKRIASTIRTLVHDTGQSHSLITQIENHPDNKLDEPMIFFDKNGIPETSLGEVIIYVGCRFPRIKVDISRKEFLETFRESKNREHWWKRMILGTSETTKRIWTRKDLTLMYANKENGSHVDPIIPTDFISAQNSVTYIGADYEIGVGYVIMFEAGVSMLQSLNNYITKIKSVS